MIKRNMKPVLVAISSVVNDRTRNVREDRPENYDLEPLINDLQMRGQQDAATLEKVGDIYYPIKGFRRTGAIAAAAERGLVYGEGAPDAGKPINSILAFVYENLSERERTELLLDHGQRKGLNRVELQNAFERSFAAKYTDKEIVTLMYSLLEMLYPASRKVEEGPNGETLVGEKLAQARFEYYKGVLQTAKRAYESPRVLREEYYKKLRGEQNWPTNSELKDLLVIHQKEVQENPMFSRENPGPKFLDKWNAVKDSHKDSGTTRPKSAAMRNRSQIEESEKTLDSPISKVYQRIQLGDIPVDRLVVIDKMMLRVWNGEVLSEQDKNEIASWFPKPATPAEAPKA